MKKLLSILTLILLMVPAQAASKYDSAYSVSDTTPMAVFVYADWADNYDGYLNVFRTVQQKMGDTYNYVELDIASEDAKAYSEQNVILPRLPYIMLYRSKCKFARLIDRNCASSAECIIPKMKSFKRQ